MHGGIQLPGLSQRWCLLRRLEIKSFILRSAPIALDEFYALFFGDFVECRLGIVSMFVVYGSYVGRIGTEGSLPGGAQPSTPLPTSEYSAIVYHTAHSPKPRGYHHQIGLQGDL